MHKMITVQDAVYSYSDDEHLVLKNITFDVERGEWVSIVGHNGSGKSTMAKAIDGLLKLTSGAIEIDGTALTEDTVWKIREKIGFVFQNPDNQFVGATVADDVAFGLENRHVSHDEMVAKVDEALHLVHMEAFADREPAGLSGGQKQRVALAGVIAMRPEIVILDEATSMLDPEGRQEIMQLMRELKQTYDFTVLTITHDIDETAFADRILLIDDGELVAAGTPEQVLTNGTDLVDRGLELPYAERLLNQLNLLHIDVPQQYMTNDQVVKWLCQKLNSSK